MVDTVYTGHLLRPQLDQPTPRWDTGCCWLRARICAC